MFLSNMSLELLAPVPRPMAVMGMQYRPMLQGLAIVEAASIAITTAPGDDVECSGGRGDGSSESRHAREYWMVS